MLSHAVTRETLRKEQDESALQQRRHRVENTKNDVRQEAPGDSRSSFGLESSRNLPALFPDLSARSREVCLEIPIQGTPEPKGASRRRLRSVAGLRRGT